MIRIFHLRKPPWNNQSIDLIHDLTETLDCDFPAKTMSNGVSNNGIDRIGTHLTIQRSSEYFGVKGKLCLGGFSCLFASNVIPG